MKHRSPIRALIFCLSWVLFLTWGSTLSAKIRMIAPDVGWPELVNLSTAELVQRFVRESEEYDMDNMLNDEITRRLKRASPGDRSEVITALLSIAQDASQEPDHRRVAIARIGWVSVPVVVDVLAAIAMDYREDSSVRFMAVMELSTAARSHESLIKKAFSALVRIVHTTDDLGGNSFLIHPAIIAIGECGELGTGALLELWDSKRFQNQMPRYRSSFIRALGYTGDARALDFLLPRLEEADMKEDCRELFDALGHLGRQFRGKTIFRDPREPDLVSYSEVKAALEKGLRITNHPNTIAAARWWLANITR